MAKCDMATAEGCVAFGCAQIGYCTKNKQMSAHLQDTQPKHTGMTLDEMREHEADAIANRTLGIGMPRILRWQQAGGPNNAR